VMFPRVIRTPALRPNDGVGNAWLRCKRIGNLVIRAEYRHPAEIDGQFRWMPKAPFIGVEETKFCAIPAAWRMGYRDAFARFG